MWKLFTGTSKLFMTLNPAVYILFPNTSECPALLPHGTCKRTKSSCSFRVVIFCIPCTKNGMRHILLSKARSYDRHYYNICSRIADHSRDYF